MNMYKKIKVTLSQEYLLPINEKTGTSYDNRTIEDITEEWFVTYPLYQYHATRDSTIIKGSQQVLSVEVDNIPIELK